MKKSKLSKIAAILYAVALFFFIFTFSIGLPIYFRPFYYAHISALDLARVSGYNAAQIRVAYDEVLNYLTLPGGEFSAGEMAFSPEGAAHFADCKVLFNLNAAVLISSGIVIVILLILKKSGKIDGLRIGRRPAGFYAAVTAMAAPIIIGILAAVDFDRAFTVFHKVFFKGKENWIFDPATDEIINVLPQEFFRNCAILIGAAIIVLCVGILAAEVQADQRRKKGD